MFIIRTPMTQDVGPTLIQYNLIVIRDIYKRLYPQTSTSFWGPVETWMLGYTIPSTTHGLRIYLKIHPSALNPTIFIEVLIIIQETDILLEKLVKFRACNLLILHTGNLCDVPAKLDKRPLCLVVLCPAKENVGQSQLWT